MKKFIVTILLAICLSPMLGCVDINTLFAAADAGVKAYETEVDKSSSEYVLADKIDNELSDLVILFHNAEAASAVSKPGVSSQIAAVASSLAADGKTLLDLIAVKNPQKQQIVEAVLASVEVVIVYIQDKYPDPSGNSVQLNSSAAQLKAAAK